MGYKVSPHLSCHVVIFKQIGTLGTGEINSGRATNEATPNLLPVRFDATNEMRTRGVHLFHQNFKRTLHKKTPICRPTFQLSINLTLNWPPTVITFLTLFPAAGAFLANLDKTIHQCVTQVESSYRSALHARLSRSLVATTLQSQRPRSCNRPWSRNQINWVHGVRRSSGRTSEYVTQQPIFANLKHFDDATWQRVPVLLQEAGCVIFHLKRQR